MRGMSKDMAISARVLSKRVRYTRGNPLVAPVALRWTHFYSKHSLGFKGVLATHFY